MTTLLPFHTQLANAWKLFLNRWGSAVALQFLYLIPGILMFPLMIEYAEALLAGIDPAAMLQGSAYVTSFLIGFILLVLVGVFVAAATGILFAARKKPTLGEVVTSTLMRYVSVLYTSVLSTLVVLVALIPAFALNYWYTVFAYSGVTIAGNGIAAVDAIVLIALVALLIPAVIIATWVMYAPLVVALKAAPAGFTAIMFAKEAVHHHVWQIVWRMVGSMALYQIVSASVANLPYASYLVPFALSIIIIAFFVEMYKELQGGASYGK